MSNKIHISEHGDDKNDGSENAPIHSWARRLQLKTGNDIVVIMGNAEATIQRLYREIDAKNEQFPQGGG